MVITMSIELSSSSHACNNLCSTATEGDNNKMSSAYNTMYIPQEAQLSQRDRVTLHVIEYFAKSLKVTRGHSK